MQLVMGVPQLIQVVHSGGVGHDSAILAGLLNKLLSILRIAADLAPVPAQLPSGFIKPPRPYSILFSYATFSLLVPCQQKGLGRGLPRTNAK